MSFQAAGLFWCSTQELARQGVLCDVCTSVRGCASSSDTSIIERWSGEDKENIGLSNALYNTHHIWRTRCELLAGSRIVQVLLLYSLQSHVQPLS